MSSVLKALLKNDYHKLVENMSRASYPEDPKEPLSFVDSNGVLTLRGFVPGLFTIMEAMLIVEPCGKVYAAILDDGAQFLYFTNDDQYIDRIPASIDQWRSGIEKARSGIESTTQLPVVFKSKDAAAEEVKRLENETLQAFATRNGPPQSELTHSVIETEAWGHQKTVLAFYEMEFETSGQTEQKIVGYMFLPQDANTYQKILIGTFEPEGGPPTIEAVFFANADRDKAKELVVICSWPQRHYDFSGTLYGTFIFDDLRAATGPAELRSLEGVSERVSGDCECEWRNGKKRMSRYKTAASVRAGLKKLGFQ